MHLLVDCLEIVLINWRRHTLLFDEFFGLGTTVVCAVIWWTKMSTLQCVFLPGEGTNSTCKNSKLQFLYLQLSFPVDSPTKSISTTTSESYLAPIYHIAAYCITFAFFWDVLQRTPPFRHHSAADHGQNIVPLAFHPCEMAIQSTPWWG